jgi:hypothetical protein
MRHKQERTAQLERELRAQIEDLRSFLLTELENYLEPTSFEAGAWWSPLWHVVRASKVHPSLQERDGFESWRAVRNIVPLKFFLEADSRLADEEDVAAAWASAWDRIRYLPGETLLDAALRDADNSPVVPPCERTPGYSRFLALCAVLARLRGEEISIGVERWAELLHVRPNTISIWRQWAVEDGVLQLIRPHCHPARRATEYRVLLDRLPPVRGTL